MPIELKTSADVRRVLLQVMLDYHMRHGFDRRASLDNAFAEDGYIFPRGLPDKVVSGFVVAGLIDEIIIMGRSTSHALTGAGIERAEKENDQQQESMAVQAEEETLSAPAADRVVPLNHNQENYKKMIESVDTAIREVDGINDDLGEEFDAAKADLTSGRRFLSEARIKISRVQEFIMTPLHYLLNITINESTKMVIQATLSRVKDFFLL